MSAGKRERCAVALFGAGRIGSVHAGNIAGHPGSRLTAVVDVDAVIGGELAARYGATVRSREEVLADDAVDAILIASSTNTHADLIEAGIAAGKAVFCEKPVDLSLSRSVDCLAAIGARAGRVMLGFNRRFDPNFQALKGAFDHGEIGRGELLTVTSFDPSPPPLDYVAVSGGLFRDMAIHDFDLVCWLFGAAPTRISASASCLVDSRIGEAGDVDTAVTVLHFADGRLATIRNSRRAVYGYDQRIEILGAGGLLCAGNVTESTLAKSTSEGVTSAKPEYFFLERYSRAYQAEWSHFVEAVRSDEEPSVSVRDGVIALAIAEAAGESLESGRTVPIAYPEGVSPR